MNHKEKVLRETETRLTRNQHQADVFVYTRSTRDGVDLYFRRYGAAIDMNIGSIDYEGDCTTDLYELQEMLEETILQTGCTIYIGLDVLEELQEELQEPNSDFWESLSYQID
jgi:hypothetical protein